MKEIIDFSSCINLYQPEELVSVTNADISRYPDNSYEDFKEIIAKNYEINPNKIALFNGATAGIYELFRKLKKKNIFLYAPLYGEYENAAIEAKKNIYLINRITELEDEPNENTIVVFVNPSTPEGTYYDLEELMKTWMKLNCIIVLDESFLEFEELKSQREKINTYKKLYIVQSFSSFYSSAGVRVGAIFSHEKNIKNLQTQPWQVSSLDESFLSLRLADEAFKVQTREAHTKQKAELISILESSELFDEIVESDANFILTHSQNGEAIFKHLLEEKILVRTCGSFDYMSDDWLRFAVKDAVSQKKLAESLQNFQ